MSLPQNALDHSFNLPKRLRPPNLTFTNERKPVSSIQIQADSPTDLSDDEEDDILKLDSGDSSPSTSPMAPMLSFSSSDEDATSDDINQGFAALEQLRKSVQKNLRLRPIRSHASLNSAKMRSSFGSFSPHPVREEVASPASSTASSYFTPTSDARDSPLSARWVGSSASDSSSLPRSPSPQQRQSRSVDPGCLYERLTAPTRPLLVDTRPPAVHLSFHIKHSINVAIPSLILKRCRKPGGGFQSLDSLRQFITTEEGKAAWDELMRPGGSWDGDVVVYDDEMDEKDRENMAITAWALLSVIQPLLSYGNVDYLIGGISSAGHHPDLETLIVSGGGLDFGDEPANTGPKGGGLFQLVTNKPFHPKSSLEIEQNSSSSMSSTFTAPPRSPLPLMPMTSNYKTSNVNVMDASPSPPPSQVTFRRPPPPRRPSVPNLRRLDTKSAERLSLSLPKLHVRTVPIKSATLSVPPTSLYPPSPSHLNLAHSNHTPPASAHWVTSPASPLSSAEIFSAYFTPPHTPGTPKGFYMPPSPHTARPEDQPPTTEEPFPPFTVSTILPNFLYLGPELTSPDHVKELRDLGVQRILNIAAECDADDHGLRLKNEFDRYFKIPMRDTVEEENIAQGVREVCEILDDARLHSSPTYVHCKAGKSRSVTAVMAYLIHANHWTLSRAYSFVLERRKGISPNIGFVSELMSFEEEELGGKSVGVQPPSTNGDGIDGDGGGGSGHMNYAVAAGNRRGGHVRESLPPALLGGEPGPLSAGGMEMRVMGDSGQEVEIKDATGRYRHARRAPVDETTLQPMRRVSKAGLESSVSVS